jgi:hypothetical protein
MKFKYKIWSAAIVFTFLAALYQVVSISTHAVADTVETPYGLYDWSQPGAIIDQTQAATVTSNVIRVRSLLGMSVQVDHGNVVGTLVMYSSNDCVTYYAVQGVAFAAISGSGGEVIEIGNLRSLCYEFIYTHTSGTGLLKVTPFVKGKNL